MPKRCETSGDSEGDDVILCSLVNERTIPSEVFESYGTIRFINEFPLVINVLLNGGTLVMDEFDARVRRIHGEIAILAEQNEKLIQQRDLLLPRLMSGKLEV